MTRAMDFMRRKGEACQEDVQEGLRRVQEDDERAVARLLETFVQCQIGAVKEGQTALNDVHRRVLERTQHLVPRR